MAIVVLCLCWVIVWQAAKISLLRRRIEAQQHRINSQHEIIMAAAPLIVEAGEYRQALKQGCIPTEYFYSNN